MNPTRNSKQQGGRKVETAAATGHGRGHIAQGSVTAAPVIESLRHAATKEHCQESAAAPGKQLITDNLQPRMAAHCRYNLGCDVVHINLRRCGLVLLLHCAHSCLVSSCVYESTKVVCCFTVVRCMCIVKTNTSISSAIPPAHYLH